MGYNLGGYFKFGKLQLWHKYANNRPSILSLSAASESFQLRQVNCPEIQSPSATLTDFHQISSPRASLLFPDKFQFHFSSWRTWKQHFWVGFFCYHRDQTNSTVLPVGDSSALCVVLNKHIALLIYQLEMQVKSFLKIFILTLFLQAMKRWESQRLKINWIHIMFIKKHQCCMQRNRKETNTHEIKRLWRKRCESTSKRDLGNRSKNWNTQNHNLALRYLQGVPKVHTWLPCQYGISARHNSAECFQPGQGGAYLYMDQSEPFSGVMELGLSYCVNPQAIQRD